MATCPECDAEIEIDDDDLEEMEIGDPWDCDACGTRLRVVTLDPLDFETDDDDDDDDDDEKRKNRAWPRRPRSTRSTTTTTTRRTIGTSDGHPSQRRSRAISGAVKLRSSTGCGPGRR